MGRLESIRQRGRNYERKMRKSFIVIGCEGKNKTEEIYFKNYNSRNCIIKFATGSNTDPVGIVEELIKFIDSEIGREDTDKYYAIFDTDVNQNKQSQINEAQKIAEKNGVEIITSTPTFEFWYLLHFGFTTKKFTSSEEVQKDLKKKITGYTKNMNTYSILKKSTLKAINNAKQVEKYHLSFGQDLDNENCNPYTGVYKVVEELIKRNKC
jgi:hypothetical protein